MFRNFSNLKATGGEYPLLDSKALILAAVFLALAGCGGGSSGGGGGEQGPGPGDDVMADDVPVVTTFDGATSTFRDVSVSFQYPATWNLDQSNPDVTAIVLDRDTNSLGGNNNCAYLRAGNTNGDLLSLTEEMLDQFNDRPEPDVSFVTVNGASASRIVGQLNAGGTLVRAMAQSIYAFPIGHVVLCIGEGSDDEFGLIFDTFVVR